MGSFEVRGGKKLSGEIIPQGAKNEALQIISAVLLTADKVTITNIPDIIDVNLLIELLGEMGVKINRTGRTIKYNGKSPGEGISLPNILLNNFPVRL